MILFCGDTHGQFEQIIESVEDHRPAAVILLGDVQAQRPQEVELTLILDMTEIWFIHGNHDTDSEADQPSRHHLLWRTKPWRTSAGHGDWHQWQRQTGASTVLRVLAVAQCAIGSEAVGLHGGWGCESGEIAGGDSLPASTALARVAGVTLQIALAGFTLQAQSGDVRAPCCAVALATVTLAALQDLHLPACAGKACRSVRKAPPAAPQSWPDYVARPCWCRWQHPGH